MAKALLVDREALLAAQASGRRPGGEPAGHGRVMRRTSGRPGGAAGGPRLPADPYRAYLQKRRGGGPGRRARGRLRGRLGLTHRAAQPAEATCAARVSIRSRSELQTSRRTPRPSPAVAPTASTSTPAAAKRA